MKENSSQRKWLSALGAAGIIAAVLIVVSCNRQDSGQAKSSKPEKGPPQSEGKAAVTEGISVDVVESIGRPLDEKGASSEAKKAVRMEVAAGEWLMFGGSPSRNMVNPLDKDIPTEWSVEQGQEKNIKW